MSLKVSISANFSRNLWPFWAERKSWPKAFKEQKSIYKRQRIIFVVSIEISDLMVVIQKKKLLILNPSSQQLCSTNTRTKDAKYSRLWEFVECIASYFQTIITSGEYFQLSLVFFSFYLEGGCGCGRQGTSSWGERQHGSMTSQTGFWTISRLGLRSEQRGGRRAREATNIKSREKSLMVTEIYIHKNNKSSCITEKWLSWKRSWPVHLLTKKKKIKIWQTSI